MRYKIETFNPRTHYFDFAAILIRYFREVNREDYMEETPYQQANGQWTSIKKVDLKINNLPLEGIRCKIATEDGEIIGFLWYRGAFNDLVVCIDAFYMKPAHRKRKIGMDLINSICNEFNKGTFEIYCQIHGEDLPSEMLEAFHDWERVRPTNFRDLVLVRGTWNKKKVQEKNKLSVHRLAVKKGE